MDHLPYPDNPLLAPLEIPYISSKILGPERTTLGSPDTSPSFIEFSNRAQPVAQYWRECDSDSAAPKAQAFVFFGLLGDTLGPSFNVDEWVQVSNFSKESVITLSNLQEKVYAAATRGNVNVEATKALPFRARHHVEHIRTKSPLANRISLSIEILSWSLATLFDLDHGLNMKFIPRTKDDVLAERLLAVGWCPRWTKIFCDKYSPPLLHYLSGMPVNAHSGHDRCSPSECKGQYAGDKYVTRHTPRDCKCEKSGPSAEKTASIIENEGVPLMRLSETRGGNIEIDVVEAGFGKPFVAISHVWSGGLGNPHENTIPMCQLKFLYTSAKRCQQMEYGKGIWGITHKQDVVWKRTKYYRALLRVLGEDENEGSKEKPLESYLETADRWSLQGANEDPDSVYVWFDTFCVPVEGDESKENDSEDGKPKDHKPDNLKNKAINKMAFVYAAAMHVLVIDQTIRDVSFDQTSDPELAALLLTSPWMSRAWTFQEGSLARQFSFLLKDKMINPRRWMSDVPADRCGSLFERALKVGCISFINAIPDIINNSVGGAINNQQTGFIPVWNQLSHRSTSQPKDYHGLLAVMLNLSALEILELKKDQQMSDHQRRMLGILRCQESLPLSMLVLPYPDGTTLVPGYEWISTYPSGALSELFGSMSWTEDGAGLRFLPSETKSSIFVVNIKGNIQKQIRILASSPDAEAARSTEQLALQIDLLPPVDKVSERCRDKTACLLLYGYMAASPAVSFQGVGACFVLSSLEDSQQLRLRFVCPLTYRSTPGGFHRRPAAKMLSSQKTGFQGLVAEPAFPDALCFLECDPEVWPQPKYRRPTARILQKSFSTPACILVLSLWTVLMGVTFSDPSSADWGRSLYTALESSFSIYPWWLRKLNVPLHLFGLAFRYPRFSCPFLLIFTRMTAFYMLEYPRLEFIAQRIRYERYAESFDYVDTADIRSKSGESRFGKERLYQYQPLWRLCIPGLIAALNILSATWPQVRRFLVYLPYSPKVDANLLSVIGKGALLETLLRVAGEAVWRYLRLDTSSN
ncbi:MAG: hypothetical protein M1839_004197 [Geoglossum umbratile]|nr:MAG: hypothetical protein M1839_004197 [Geoglossum umbratile]